jgi:hypothetical protein
MAEWQQLSQDKKRLKNAPANKTGAFFFWRVKQLN